MIFTYNKEHVGDVLMVIVKNSGDSKLDVERKGNVARVFLKETGETVAWNIFEVSSMFEIAERGQVFLTDDQVARLNQELQDNKPLQCRHLRPMLFLLHRAYLLSTAT